MTPVPPINLLVTITFNALKHGILEPFFACIRAQADQDFVLLVIDNASTDGTADYLRGLDLPNLRLILNGENVGFGRACNQGIALAREMGAPIVTFINNDVEFGPDLVGGMARSLRDTGAAALSPLITPFDQPDHVWFVTGSFRWGRGIIPYHDRIWQPLARAPGERIRRTAFATGCCLAFRTDVFDPTAGGLAGFDDRFFVYWEDADLSMTLLERGWPVVVDTGLTLRHKVSTSTGGSFSAFSVYHFTRGHLLFVRKHYPAAALVWVLPASAAKMLLNVARRRMHPREIGAWFRGLVAGLRD